MFDFAEKTSGMSAIEVLNYYRNLYYAEPQVTERGIVANAINNVMNTIGSQKAEVERLNKSAVDVAEVIHSEWHTATVRMNCIDVTCKNCHNTEKISITNYFEYCPHCGAKMDGERKDENDRYLRQPLVNLTQKY